MLSVTQVKIHLSHFMSTNSQEIKKKLFTIFISTKTNKKNLIHHSYFSRKCWKLQNSFHMEENYICIHTPRVYETWGINNGDFRRDSYRSESRVWQEETCSKIQVIITQRSSHEIEKKSFSIAIIVCQPCQNIKEEIDKFYNIPDNTKSQHKELSS